MYVTLRGAPSADPEQIETSAPTAGSSLGRRIPGTVLALGAVSFFTDISSESVNAILPLYITAVLGMGPLAYGFIDGVYQGVSAIVRILGGWWADRSQRPKRVALAGYGLSALSRLAMLPASGFFAITGVVAVDRLGKGLRTGPRDAMIAGASDPKQLGRNFGVHRALDTAGALIGPLLAFAVLAAIPIGLGGYRSVFVLSAAFALIGVAVLLLAVPSARKAPAKIDRAATVARRPPWRDLTNPALRRLMLAAGLLGLVTVGDGFIYLMLADTGAFGATYFPLLIVGTNAAYLAFAIPLGRLGDRIGRGKVFVGGHVVLLAAYGLTASQLGGAWWVVGVLLLLGTFYAATDGVLAALASARVPEASRAGGIASAQTVVALSRFGSSVAFGLLWQFADRPTAIAVMAVGLLVVLPLAALLLRSLRERAA
jgi:MFS family permease